MMSTVNKNVCLSVESTIIRIKKYTYMYVYLYAAVYVHVGFLFNVKMYVFCSWRLASACICDVCMYVRILCVSCVGLYAHTQF
jgi:hypothetical protein